jgi:GMP synthase (glutamine-hydrolysing)
VCAPESDFRDDPLTKFAQELAWNLGGTVAKCEHREYGFARVQIKKFGSDPGRLSVDALFEGLGDEMEVRMRRE